MRRILVTTWSSWWRRKWRGEAPTASVPDSAYEPWAEVDSRDMLRGALNRLPRRQRAVVILRYYEDLSGGEVDPPLSRGRAAVFVRCLGLGPVVVRLGARESLTAPCDGQQHQRNAGGPLLRPNPDIPDEVQASTLTTYQVVVAVWP